MKSSDAIAVLGGSLVKENFANLRITVDNPEDFAVVGGVFKELYPQNKNFNLNDILDLYCKKPEIFSANRHFKRIC